MGAAYSNLYKSFELNGNIDSAYIYKGLALQATEKALEDKVLNLVAFQKEAFKEKEQLQLLEQEKIETKNKLRTYALFSVLGAFLVIGFFLYRNNQQKQKANLVLQEQKEKVERTLTELKSTQSQLIQSEKMASLGELTAGIAHEIQNPLNFVNNFSEVSAELVDEMNEEIATGNTQLSNGNLDKAAANLQNATEIANDLKQNLEKINHHGKRAGAIVTGMLQHSRSSSGVKEPTNINALADEYLRLAYHGLRAKDKEFNATMKTDFDESIGNINIIPQDIGRVILNLITNAFYACTERMRSVLNENMLRDAQHVNQGYVPTVSVITKKENNKIFISVKDNGNGIPQKILDKIFQPFFTTKPTGQGTGLGLSLSYDIVKVHGGELKVETKEGEGSTFEIILPITNA
ncbi:MAG: GHKL domain-containing protein [Sphingobacteriia bacterium]|nr:MAG: GHKL domain-containing protein [Sphingobacteriia bacterium]